MHLEALLMQRRTTFQAPSVEFLHNRPVAPNADWVTSFTHIQSPSVAFPQALHLTLGPFMSC